MGTVERIRHVIMALNMSETITEREDIFLGSVSKYFDEHEMITDRQLEVLEEILREDNQRA